MMQGDSGMLAVRIRNNAGSEITPADITDLEITIGSMRKTYGKGELVYADGLWFFPLSQQETLGCSATYQNAQVRLRWPNGVVEGKYINGIRFSESFSREVI